LVFGFGIDISLDDDKSGEESFETRAKINQRPYFCPERWNLRQ